MKTDDQIRGWIHEAERGIERVGANKDLKHPYLPIAEYRAQIAALKWVWERAEKHYNPENPKGTYRLVIKMWM